MFWMPIVGQPETITACSCCAGVSYCQLGAAVYTHLPYIKSILQGFAFSYAA